jgi:dephospho-CoA kinase
MLIIGLTGGIGSGKSTVAGHFETLGVPVIDADVITRQLVEPGQPALQEIIEHFGTTILLTDGRLDRAQLRRLVFDNPEARRELEAILHPRARIEAQRQLAQLNAPYCVLCVPLLIEAGWTDLVQRVLVIDTPRELQIQRIQQRDGLSNAEAEAIIASQADASVRLAAADDIINNDGDMESLLAQVDSLHQHYLQLATQS